MPVSRHLVWNDLLRFFCAALLLAVLLLRTSCVYAQMQPRTVLSRTKPEYPALAIRMHIGGSVLVLASVTPNGTVSHVHATSGHAFLQGPAEQAVRQWKFSKAPMPSETTVEVQFSMDPHS